MSGRYLYCQNPECGIYLNASGDDECWSCGWHSCQCDDIQEQFKFKIMSPVDAIRSEIANLYIGTQNSDTTENNIAKLDSAQLAEFIINAFNRGWITIENLGIDTDGNLT